LLEQKLTFILLAIWGTSIKIYDLRKKGGGMGSFIFWVVVGTTIWMTYDASDLKIPTYGNTYSLNTGALAWFVSAVFLWILAFPYYLVRRSSVLRQRSVRNATSGCSQPSSEVISSDQFKDILFCEIAVDLTFISPADVDEALKNQKVDESIHGLKKPVGAYLLQAGKLNKEQISRIIVFQEKFSPKQSPKTNLTLASHTAALQTELSDNPWFYEFKGQRYGGVSQAEIVDLIKSGQIGYGTPVWQKGFSSWVTVESTLLKTFLNEPPPLTGSLVNNSVVWVLAFAPILGKILEYIIAEFSYGNRIIGHAAVRAGHYWYVTLILNIILTVLDEIQLKKAGHNTDKFKGWLWLIPVYLYQRAKNLNQGLSYFIVWLLSFFLALGD